jgi:hypothetical protein
MIRQTNPVVSKRLLVKQWLIAPNSQDSREFGGESHFSRKWPLASVGESGESTQHGLANVGESGESAQHSLASVGYSGEYLQNGSRMSASLASLKKAILASTRTRKICARVAFAYF